jgi:PAS domain-containing protein
MGLLLHADPRLAPAAGDAFLVTDDRLLICALSQAAERLFRRSEPSVIHRPVSDLLVDVGADEAALPSLATLLSAAAAGALDVTEAVVATVEGGREHHPARLGPCGPPTAALLIIDG